jgi:DNA-binding transcriptional ArsR family regulator
VRPRSSRFSPRLLDGDVLAQLTVAREPLITRLVGNLSAAIASGQSRFDLLVGPRGVGKSHLLGLVEARIRGSADLHGRVVVVSLAEEFHPSSLLHLLAKLLEELPEDPTLPPVAAQLRAVRDRESSEATEMVVTMIRARLAGRSLLLMLENLDAIFRDLGRKAQARLRKITQTEQGWSIFATARTAILLAKQTEPFHGTFVVEHLDALTPVQCREMMTKLARVHEVPELEGWLETDAALNHVRAAHHLVGGNPRVVAMLFHHLDAERFADFESNFYSLAEEVTPYFQEQMSRLSAGQRPVMEFLAERWAPASVKEIAEGTYNEPTTVSTHLRALRRDRLVQSIAVGKERFYEIAEPLHRIARAMKQDKRLGAAIAHTARIWALLSGKNDEHVEFVSIWPKDFFRAESEYIDKVAKELIRAYINHEPGIDHHIEEILRHAQGHPIQSVALLAQLLLGRDRDALATAEIMAQAGLRDFLAQVHVVWLGLPSPECPLAQEFLDAVLAEAELSTETVWKCVHPIPSQAREQSLLRVATRLGSKVVVDILEGFQYNISDSALALLSLSAWLRRDFECIQTSSFVTSLLTGAFERNRSATDVSVLLSILGSCLALANETRLYGTPWDSYASIPLWIASGRDVPALRHALEALSVDVSFGFEHALEAEDTARAFARLGAESRAFAREFLSAVEATDLLARLPPEPTPEPD